MRPGLERGSQGDDRLAQSLGRVAAMVMMVVDDADTGAAVELEDVLEVERGLVVLDDDARAGALAEAFVGRRPALEGCCAIP